MFRQWAEGSLVIPSPEEALESHPQTHRMVELKENFEINSPTPSFTVKPREGGEDRGAMEPRFSPCPAAAAGHVTTQCLSFLLAFL